MEVVRGEKRKVGRTISFSEECLDELEKKLRDVKSEENVRKAKKLTISDIVETACWKFIGRTPKKTS